MKGYEMGGSPKPLLRQVNIVHVSDLHFGRNHRFQSPLTAMADRPSDEGYPTLSSKICEDLEKQEIDGPIIFCASGDFAEIASAEEFEAAEAFFRALFAHDFDDFSITPQNTFIVPGNHDVVYNKSGIGLRFQQWTEFYNRIYGTDIRRENPLEMSVVHDRVDDLGVVIATLNSSMFVEKDTPDEGRGRVDVDQLAKIERELEAMDASRLDSSIRVCMIHHHPVLIPQLVEAGRGYDAVNNAGLLMQLLKRFGFHAVLHGHKHNPFTFTDDIESTITKGESHPIFVSCAVSLGSVELPRDEGVSNCYNIIRIKFHPEGDQFRVRSETRRLTTHNESGFERLPPNWEWKEIKTYDRYFQKPSSVLLQSPPVAARDFNDTEDREAEQKRREAYKSSRGFFPYVHVKPSLMQGQAYEAICELVQHRSKTHGVSPPPSKVIWSAGEMFQVKEIDGEASPTFRVSFQYWGSMLIQARLIFPDGHVSLQHIYAPVPKAKSNE